MQQESRSKISFLPLFLIIAVNVLAFLLFRGKGLFILAIFFNPIFSIFNRLFLRYEIKDNTFTIKDLFSKTEIPIASIRYVEEKRANIFQKYLVGFPATYQIVGYNTYDDRPIYPRKELVFNPDSPHLYFKT